MADKRAQPGDPGQAGKVDPKGPNRFEPGTKAHPAPDSTHGKPGSKPKGKNKK